MSAYSGDLTRLRSADHPFTAWTSWEPERPGEAIRDAILMSRAHDVLLDRTGGWNFDEVRWLESEIERLEELLA